MYQVLSPDGFPITRDENFSSLEKAKEALVLFIKRYEKQGYYSSVDYGRIPINQIENYCEIVKL